MGDAELMLEGFAEVGVGEKDLLARLAWLRDVIGPRLERYLGYYRNPMMELAAALPCASDAGFLVRPFRQYQEVGLPARITGFRRAADGSSLAVGAVDVQRKEVVIENDIAWRVDTLVDFAASRMPGITSTARDESTRSKLTVWINQLLESACACGALGFLQELVLRGAICGSAWVELRPTAALLARLSGIEADGAGAGEWIRLEVVEAQRVCPVGKCVAVLTGKRKKKSISRSGILERMRAWFSPAADGPMAEEFSFDLYAPARWQRYREGGLAEAGENPLGFVPFVRYENAGDPAAGTSAGPAGSEAVDVGVGEVEPLIGLQDELNTRLSDRAYRVTMSSFRMYLGKGIEDFVKRPVGPGQMWGTDNERASIEAFGGDDAMPSEEAHINDVREGLDKISGVSPVAAGVIRGKLGNLTSAVALRITLIALLARTERKRAALTRVLEEIVRMGLEMMDRAGVMKTAPEDRGIDVNWPTAIPESDMDRLTEAQSKLAIGVPRDVVMKELGYGELETEEQQVGEG